MKAKQITASYFRRDWLLITIAALTGVPLVALRFFGLGAGSAIVAAIVTGVAIVAAAFMLNWGVEGLETLMPQGVALAVLALVEVAPEYAFEVILAYRQQTTLAAASMTGANRLLLGFGWPLLLFTAYFSAKRKGFNNSEIRLGPQETASILFLLIASLYAFVIVLKSSMSLLDSAILVLIYAAYIFFALRIARRDEEGCEIEQEMGIAARTKMLPSRKKWFATSFFLAFGGFVLWTGAEPFIDAILGIAKSMGVSQFTLIQWLAPFLSEFPESLTAYIWAASVVAAAMGLSNLISSKLNQWTLLIAAIPIAYSLGAGHTRALQLTEHVRDEVFITAAQSLFGSVLLLSRRFTLRHALLLLVLFILQFVFAIDLIRVILAWIYVALSIVYLAWKWRDMSVLHETSEALGRWVITRLT